MGKDGDPGGEASAVTQEPKRRDPKMQAAKVHLLDKSQRDYELNRGSNGDVLFQIVTKQLGIEEREYFSLCFYDATGTRHWLYNDKRIIRQLKDLPWEFHFEVKFYPNAPSTMNDEHARYNLFLQMKHDLFTGRLPATIPTQASLASLIAQAEFGDASHSAEYEQYLRTSNIVPNMSDELMNTIKEEQIKHRGLTPLEAETKFLELCKQLSMYGVHLFPAKDSNNQPVSIGICAGGINIYNDLVRIHRLAWQNINKISYKKNTFSVKMKPGEFDEKKEVTLLYKLTDYAHAKRVWKCGVEHHTFFRLIQPEEKQKGGVFRWGSGRFRYHGRTQFQTKMASQMFDTPSSNAVQRSNSARLSQSCDNMHQRTPLSTLQYSEKELGSKEPLTSPAVSYDVSASKRVSSTNGKAKKTKPAAVETTTTSVSERYEGPVDSVAPHRDLESLPLEHQPLVSNGQPSEVTEEERRFRLIARIRHEGEEEILDKGEVKPESYGLASTSYDGPLEDLAPSADLEQSKLGDHATVYHSGQSWLKTKPAKVEAPVETGKKKATLHLRSSQTPEKTTTPVEEEKPEVRLIARVVPPAETDETATTSATTPSKSHESKTKESTKFGFWKAKKTKPAAVETTTYSVSERYEGPVDSVAPHRDLESLPLEHQPLVSNGQPSEVTEEERRFRLIARIRHEGEEEILDKGEVKPESYGLASTSYDGPLEDLAPSADLEQSKLGDHATVYHSGQSWLKTKPAKVEAPVETGKKKATLHLRSSQTPEKTTTPVEEEKPEVRLIARVVPPAETDETATTSATTPSKSHESKTKESTKFGFWKAKKTKPAAVETTTYSVSERYEGPVDSVAPHRDLESLPLEHQPLVSNGQPSEVTEEERRFRLIARIRHEGEEEILDKGEVKPESYGLASTSYDGPLEDLAPSADLEQSKLGDHATVYHSGQSWLKTKPAKAEAPVETGKKKATLHLRSSQTPEKTTTPVEEEKPEVRLIARVVPPAETDETATTSATTPSKSHESKTKESTKFRFWKAKKTKPAAVETTTYSVSERYEGPVDSVAPHRDLESLPLEHQPLVSNGQPSEVTEEERRFRLIARIRHEGEEEILDKGEVKPESYGLASTSYDGPLEDLAPSAYLEQSKLGDHATVYHSGQSWLKTKPAKVEAPVETGKKKATLHLRSSQTPEKTTTPVEEEKPEVRLIARVVPPAETDETATTSATTPSKSHESKTKESTKFGFWKAKKTKPAAVETTTTSVSERYEGPVDSVAPHRDLESLPLEHQPLVSNGQPSEVTEEERRFRLIARIRHEGEEEILDKGEVKPESYGLASTSYDGPLEDLAHSADLEQSKLGDHATVYHSGQSWLKTKPAKVEAPVETGKKEAILHLRSSQTPEKTTTPVEEEKPEVRLIARVVPPAETDETATTSATTPSKSHESKTKESTKFGFWKAKKTKPAAVETTTYSVSERYEGPVDSVAPHRDLESLPLEHQPLVSSGQPSEVTEEERRFRLIARIRHEGEEEILDKGEVKPESYGLASTSYDGPLEDLAPSADLEQSKLGDHATVYHSGQSWLKTKPAKVEAPVETGKKKATLHLRSSQTPEKTTTPVEEEKPEVRLIARVVPPAETDETATTSATTPSKSHESKTKESTKFGFWKAKKTKPAAVETTTTSVSERYEGPVDSVAPHRDLESLPLEHQPLVSNGQPSEVTEEERRFRLIARIRHEGEEEILDKGEVKPESYGLASTSYDGPLEDLAPSADLEQSKLGDHATVYHSGQSWLKTKPAKVEAPVETGKKKATLHLRSSQTPEKTTTPVEEEKPEVRLIARVVPPAETDETATTSATTPSKSHESKTKESTKFGFWKAKKTKPAAVETTTYSVSERYEGPVDSVAPHRDLESLPLEHQPLVSNGQPSEVTEEERRFRLIARIRHEGEEEILDKGEVKPESYGLASTSYDGPLEDLAPSADLEQSKLGDHATVYHSGQSWLKTKPAKAEAPVETGKKKATLHLRSSQTPEKTTTPVEEEKPEVRLIARVVPPAETDETATTSATTPSKSHESKTKESTKFGFWKAKKTKPAAVETTTTSVSERYEGPVDSVAPHRDLESLPLEHQPLVSNGQPSEVTEEERRFRLIARIRHEGEEEILDKGEVKPESYGLASTSYDGPLEDLAPSADLEQSKLVDHATVYHSGQSWLKTKPAKVEAPVETGKKKATLHLRSSQTPEKTTTPVEEEKPEVRLIARVVPPAETDETATTSATTPSKSHESKTKESTKFGFWKAKKTKPAAVETTTTSVSERYEGPVDSVAPHRDLESLPLEHQPLVSNGQPSEVTEEERRFRLIARIRHEGEEEILDKGEVKPESYGLASTSYDGPLEDLAPSADLEQSKLGDHATVYHSGQSWLKTKPAKVEAPVETGKKKATLHLRSSQTPEKTTTPVEEEKPEVRLIARVVPPAETDETATTSATTPSKSHESKTKESTKFGFWKAKKTKPAAVETTTYSVSERYEGPVDSVAPHRDLESLPLEHQPLVSNGQPSEVTEEERRFRLIARIRHEGEEEILDKGEVKPECYGLASTSYDGPLEDLAPSADLEQSKLGDHATVYHSGQSWLKTKPAKVEAPVETGKKKATLHLRSSQTPEKTTTPVEEEKPEVRLIARVVPPAETDETATTSATTPSKSHESKTKESTKFGFWKAKKTKPAAVETTTTSVSERYEGPVDSVAPHRDLESLPLEHQPLVSNGQPSEVTEEERRFRLIARIRHEGEEEILDKGEVKPESYGLASTSYDGPLEDLAHSADLEQSKLGDHATVYHSGQSWLKTKPAKVEAPVETGKKKAILHLRSSQTPEKTTTPVEEEKPEVRLIARVVPPAETDETATTSATTPSKSHESKTKESTKFGFWKAKKTKRAAVETTTYSVSERYEGPVDSVAPHRDLESLPLEHQPLVSNGQPSEVTEEERRFRLIARIRHEGEEEILDKGEVKPESYGLASTSYDGPLEDLAPSADLEQSKLGDHATVYHSGQSWLKTKPAKVEAPVETGKKKATLHLRSSQTPEKTTTPVEEEKPEVRLIARVVPPAETDETATTSATTPSKSHESKTKESTKFGFWKAKKTKPAAVETTTTSVSERYEGPVDSVAPHRDLESLPLEHQPLVSNGQPSEVTEEERRFRLIARIRHEGEEEILDKGEVKPESYGLASTSYDGPLEDLAPSADLEQSKLGDHATVYHSGQSWLKTKPAKVEAPVETGKKKATLHLRSSQTPEKTTTPVEEEKPEVRLIARVVPPAETDETATTSATTPSKSHESKTKESTKFGFWKAKKTKPAAVETTTYSVSERYEGPVDSVAPHRDLESLPLEHQPLVSNGQPSEVTEEERRFRLIARIRHEGEEEILDKGEVKPESYGLASTSYDGPLEDLAPSADLEQSKLGDHATVYHSGQSWLKTKPAKAEAPVETGKKKATLHLRSSQTPEKTTTPVEEEKPEVRLIARVVPPAETDETATTSATTPSKSHESKTKESTKFGFWKAKKTKPAAVETTTTSVSERCEGPVDSVAPHRDVESLPLEHQPLVSNGQPSEVTEEERRFRLIARIRHEGEEEILDKGEVKPESYGLASTSYDGPLEDLAPSADLEQSKLVDHATVYHSGQSWLKTKPAKVEAPVETGKKKATLHLRSSQTPEKTTTPVEEEKPEVRLIARVVPPAETDETATTSATTPSKSHESKTKESTKFGFWKAKKTKPAAVETTTTSVSERYEGPVDSVAPHRDLESLPLEHQPLVSNGQPSEVTEEERRFRLIARIRHEGEEEILDKGEVKPESYGLASTSYDGPLEDLAPSADLEQSKLGDHATVYHSGQSWLKTKPAKVEAPVETGKKKATLHLRSSQTPEKTTTPVEEEKPEVRLIARVVPPAETDETATTSATTPSKSHESKTKESTKFGFWKAKKTKPAAVETTTYSVSERYEGPVDSVAPHRDLESLPLEHQPLVSNGQPSEVTEEERRFRLIARIRHEGEEEILDKGEVKPESYGLASTSYDGPLEDLAPSADLEQSKLGDHATVYHSGQSWLKTKPAKAEAPVETGKKKATLHLRSSQTPEKTTTPVEEEKPEVRLIARVVPPAETDETATTSATTPSKSHESKTKESTKFGFWKAKKTKPAAVETTTTSVSERYEGPVDSVAPHRDLESLPLEHQPLVSNGQPSEVTEEERRFRLIARIRHEGEEEILDKGEVKPESYGLASTSYDGPLEDLAPSADLEQSKLGDHATVYHSGQSWLKTKPAKVEAPVETGNKKATLHLRSSQTPEKTTTPVEEEKPEVRLIARVVPPAETDETATTSATTPSKSHESKTKESTKFGFWKAKKTKPAAVETTTTSVSERYEGPVDSVAPHRDLESLPLEHQPLVSNGQPSEVTEEERRFRLIARIRHEGEEEILDKGEVKPESYGLASISYDGPLEDLAPSADLEQSKLGDHATVYHSGQSWLKTKPAKVEAPVETGKKKATLHLRSSQTPEKTTTPVEEEKPEVRLIARVVPPAETDETATTSATTPSKSHESKTKESTKFGFWKAKKTKPAAVETTTYSVSERYEGPVDSVAPHRDLESLPLEHQPLVSNGQPSEVTEEERRFRLIARIRHEGEEEILDKGEVKPESYGLASTSYDGPLEDLAPSADLEQSKLGDHATVYHSGQSWLKTKPAKVEAPVETGKKKATLHLRSSQTPEKTTTPVEEEKPEVRLIARVVPPAETDETATTSATTPSKSHESKTKESTKFGFWKAKKTKPAAVETTTTSVSERYEGPVDSVAPHRDLESLPLEHQPLVSNGQPSEVTEEERRFRLIARIRHEGEEEILDKGEVKPESYGLASTSYDGPLEDLAPSADLEQSKLGDHATVYHSGQSWLKTKPAKVEAPVETGKKKATLHLRSSQTPEKTTTPVEEEKPEVRLIARVVPPAETDETATTSATTPSKSHESKTKESTKFGFWKGKKTKPAAVETTTYSVSERYEGAVDSVAPHRDLESLPLEHQPLVSNGQPSEVTEEERRFRLIARIRHEGEEEILDKGEVKPESYGLASTSYDGPLEDLAPSADLEQSKLGDHATVYHSGQSWLKTKPAKVEAPVETGKKKATLHLRSSQTPEKTTTPVEEEKPEVRLIARVVPPAETDETATTSATTPSKSHESKTKESTKFGFWKAKKTKPAAVETTTTSVSERYEGPVDSVAPHRDLESLPLEHQPLVSNGQPSEVTEEERRFRLIARIRHEGEEEILDKGEVKPESYGLASTSYDGPLEDLAPSADLEQSKLGDHATVYHSGQSWLKTKPAKVEAPVETGKKKATLHLRSSQTPEKTTTPVEEEKPEVRLIARVVPPAETDETATTSATTPSKSHESKTKESTKFGFWKAKKTKPAAVETTTYSVSERYEGPVDSVAPHRDLESLPLEHQPLVSNGQPSEVTEEERRFRLIARIRHEGEEEILDKGEVKPESYGLASTSYDGPLEDLAPSADLEQSKLGDHATVYHSGQSWLKTKPAKVEAPVETGKKKATLHLRSSQIPEKTTTPVEEEKPEVRLIARVVPPAETDETATTSATTPSKSHESKTKESTKFGFWKAKKTKPAAVETTTTSVSERYEGPVDSVAPHRDLESLPLEHQPLVSNGQPSEVTEEERRFRLIARIRHEGEEEILDKGEVKPESYGLASTSYDGPLEDLAPSADLEQSKLGDHATVYHSGQSWLKTKPAKVEAPVETGKKKATLHLRSSQTPEKTTTPVEEEKPEVRLIARVVPPAETDETATTSATTPSKSHESKTKESTKFGFWKAKKTKPAAVETTTYSVSERYEGPVDSVAPHRDLESLPLEHQPLVSNGQPSEVTEEERRFRLIARIRHEGEEEILDKGEVKPESYGLASTSYDGPLEDLAPSADLEQSKLGDHATVYHSGQSWLKTKPAKVEAPVETGKKKATLHLRSSQTPEKTTTPVEEEKPEVRLIARVVPPAETDETATTSATTPSKSHESKTKESTKFGFWKAKKTKPAAVETTTTSVSERYEGPVDSVAPHRDLESLPLEHQPLVSNGQPSEVTEEERRFRLIARIRHEGEEEILDKGEVKPESYGLASTSYDGPLEDLAPSADLEQSKLGDHATVYHSGQSWLKTKPAKVEAPVETGKKKATLHLRSSQTPEKTATPVEEEKSEVRLIARVKPNDDDILSKKPEDGVSSVSKDRRVKSTVFTRVRAPGTSSFDVYSSRSERYEGPISVTSPVNDLENKPFVIDLSQPSTSRAHHREPLQPHQVNRQSGHYHYEGVTADGQQFVEIRVDRRVEVQLAPAFYLTGAGLGAVSEDERGLIFTATPPPMPPVGRSLLDRLGFKSKSKKAKGVKEADSSESSSSDDDQRVVTVAPAPQTDDDLPITSRRPTPPSYFVPKDADGRVVRQETQALSYHLKGEGQSPGFDPADPSLSTTIAEAERLNQRSPRLEHAERTVTVRAVAPLPVSYEESGQPHMTVASWQEKTLLPDDVTIEYDEHGNKITRTVKTSQVKHTVQKQTFQNYVVGNEPEQGTVFVEKTREEITPLGVNVSSKSPIVETHSRSVAYDNTSHAPGDGYEGLGEFVSSKTVTTGNRTIETITYKTEKDGIVETHVEHRVTIHSTDPIDHDAELSAAIAEATQMNPDMTVEKIEVRQETTA